MKPSIHWYVVVILLIMACPFSSWANNEDQSPKCEWLLMDLNMNEIPTFFNVGKNSILKIVDFPKIKVMRKDGRIAWKKVASLYPYDNAVDLTRRFGEISRTSNEPYLFYETEQTLKLLKSASKDFVLKPGDIVLSKQDPSEYKSIFGAPIFTFVILRESDGKLVPSSISGALPFETIQQSAVVLAGPSQPTTESVNAARGGNSF